MEQALLQYIQQQALFTSSQRVLVAASAGVDSTVLCFLLKKLHIDFAIAHCNFTLRGNASDEDETFTNSLAKSLNVPFFVTKFETEQIAKTHKQSIQVTARNLRYAWLEEISLTHGFDYIATAHHLNDSIETAIYNFSKGCGIRGLHGIQAKVGKIIRPLLYATKQSILDYAKENNIPFREDASNATDKYARNKIRHHVTPVLKSINPSFEQSAARTIHNLAETELLFDFFLKNIKEKITKEENNTTYINILKLLDYPATNTLLFELLRPFHFNSEQVQQIVNSLEKQVGSRFYSSTHELLIDRTELMIRPISEKTNTRFEITKNLEKLELEGGNLQLEWQIAIPSSLKTPSNIAYLDLDKLSFPLQIRRWEAGDWFQPIGMQGKKQKLKDFFVRQKYSRFDKENAWLLLSGKQICWVVGKRIDERFKISETTKTCLRLEWTAN